MVRFNISVSAFCIITAIAIVLGSCKEVNPTVVAQRIVVSTTYIDNPVQTAEPKNVLIELITGVTCSNCPAGHQQLDAVISQNSGHVIAVEYHGGAVFSSVLDDPSVSGARQNLTSTDAQAIVAATGGYPGFMPSSSVDRVYHSSGSLGNGGIYDNTPTMAGYTTTDLAPVTAQVNLNLSSVYIASARQINIGVGLHYTTAQTDSDRLSILLTEDSIVTSQEFPGSIDTGYVHMHVMRAAVTTPGGDKITVPDFVRGRADTVGYSYTIPSGSVWNPKNMHVIAFVHKYQNNTYDILQAKTISVE